MHLASFIENGFTLVPKVLQVEACISIAAHISSTHATAAGTRCLLAQEWCQSLAGQLRENQALSMLIPKDFVAVQCTYFEKSPLQNWLVAIHQDLSIPVAERVLHSELTGWSEKEGFIFVQAPDEILEKIIAVRVHLDDCAEVDGPLRIIPGSHNRGRIPSDQAALARSESREVTCIASLGDALVMCPLLLHASSKAQGTSRRRVLHFVFGPRELTHGLRWRYAI